MGKTVSLCGEKNRAEKCLSLFVFLTSGRNGPERKKEGKALSFRAVLPQDGLQHLLLQQALLQLRQEFVNLDQQGGGTDGLAFF